jgi:hypothetical protein
MLASFLAKARPAPTPTCTVCAFPVEGAAVLCGQCMREDGDVDYTCVVCKAPCRQALTERIRLPCGDVVHAACAATIDRIGRCPGKCVLTNPDATQCPSLQAWLLDYILYAHGVGPRLAPVGEWDTNDGRLTADDLQDLEDEKMFWVLRCVYEHEIGVERNDALEEKWRTKALQQRVHGINAGLQRL